MRKGPQIDLTGDVVVRLEVKTVPTVSPGVIPLEVPLVEVAGGSASRQAHPEAEGSHSLKPTRDRIQSAFLLGDI